MALTDQLISYYKMDEASGSLVDATGAHTIALGGGGSDAASGTGILNGCRVFVPGSFNYYSLADNADFSMGVGVSFSISAWLNFTSLASTRVVFIKGGDLGGGPGEYAVFATSSKIAFQVSDGSSTGEVAVNVAPSTGTWYHVVVSHDATNNLIKIRVNDGAFGSAQASWTTDVVDSTNAFLVGHDTTFGRGMSGSIDEWGLWKGRVLTGAEITTLYGGGTPPAYPFSGGGVVAHNLTLLGVGA